MSISDRYRSLAEDIKVFIAAQKKQINKDSDPALKQALRAVTKGYKIVDDLREGVGEIPRIRRSTSSAGFDQSILASALSILAA